MADEETDVSDAMIFAENAIADHKVKISEVETAKVSQPDGPPAKPLTEAEAIAELQAKTNAGLPDIPEEEPARPKPVPPTPVANVQLKDEPEEP